MAKRSSTLVVPVTVSAGAAVDTSDLISTRASIAGTFVATYQLEVSYDAGTSWAAYGSPLTAAGELALPDAAIEARVRCTAWTSGTPVGALAGIKA